MLLDEHRFAELRRLCPAALILGCSTAGEILGTRVSDDSVTATAARFNHTGLRLAAEKIADPGHSFGTGAALGRKLPGGELAHVLVISDGLAVNGSDLVNGLKSVLPEQVVVTGGLSGDGVRFQRTLVVADAPPAAMPMSRPIPTAG